MQGGLVVLEKTVEIAILFDFYGTLLTDRQRQIMALRYEDDLSLAEIAEQFAVSRQAVHDAITRTTQQLHEYERKLGLAKARRDRRDLAATLVKALREQGCYDDRIGTLIGELTDGE